jgi:hypothetical protein
MTRRRVAGVLFGVAIAAALLSGAPAAADKPSLAGTWALNRSLSEFPPEVGFGTDLMPAAWARADAAGRGRGGSGGVVLPTRRESEDDVRRARQLTDEVKNPPARLTLTQTDSAVTIKDERGRLRTFSLDGRDDVQQLDGTVVATTAKWDGTRLVIRYKVEQDRELRYTLSSKTDPPQLVVQAQFVERGGRGTITRIYEPARAGEPEPPVSPAPGTNPAPPGAGWRPGEPFKPAPIAPEPGRQTVPAVPGYPASPDRAGAAARPQQPDAELKGLSRLGIVVEDLTAQAEGCGLRRDAIETTASKSFADAGFKVIRNSDEDTYVYVSVMTSSVSPGLCVSRYDVFLYTHTMATLPYQATPVLVQVSLMHKGGMAGGAPAAHAESVVRNVKQSVEEFVSRITSANK